MRRRARPGDKVGEVPHHCRRPAAPKRNRDPRRGPLPEFGYIGLQSCDEASMVYYSVVYYSVVYY